MIRFYLSFNVADLSNYTLIALLPAIPDIFDSLTSKYITFYTLIVDHNQFSFQKNKSTPLAIFKGYYKIRKKTNYNIILILFYIELFLICTQSNVCNNKYLI